MNSNRHVAVVNSRFCNPLSMNLTLTTKPPGDKRNSHIAALDSAGNILFRSEKPSWKLFIQLEDASGHTILTMKSKFLSWHDKWQVFKGDSTEEQDLVFSMKRSSAIQFHDKWLVFLAGNTDEENCDFKIIGNYGEKNNTILKGDNSFVVAQLTRANKLNLPWYKQAFGAIISANCDHSFVMALISILDANARNEKTMAKSSEILKNIAGAIN